MQMKTKKPVQFEITKQTRNSLSELIKSQNLSYTDYLFKSRFHKSDHITTRQYARLLKTWLVEIGLDPYEYATHSIRRTKVSMIYQKTKNIRAIQLLLGHSNLDSTVRYLVLSWMTPLTWLKILLLISMIESIYIKIVYLF